jgi:2-polyprenyl-6-methoxyphenol hydroxylase-like FAD-dependent oxidoreductase
MLPGPLRIIKTGGTSIPGSFVSMKILISGGGIAGLTVANFLYRNGHQPIVVERAREFSNSGFVLSLKSFGVGTMNELGLEKKLRAVATKSNFSNFYKRDGMM